MAALFALLLTAGLGFALGWLVRSSGRRVINIELLEAPKTTLEGASEESTAAEKQVME